VAPGVLEGVESLVSANATLRVVNARLRAENDRLKALLLQIRKALGRTSVAAPGAAQTRSTRAPGPARRPPPRRLRKPITDPVLLERRRTALARAREALARKRAAARG